MLQKNITILKSFVFEVYKIIESAVIYYYNLVIQNQDSEVSGRQQNTIVPPKKSELALSDLDD